MKKLLLTGASGMLGAYVFRQLQSEWTIIGCYHQYTAPWLGSRGYALDLRKPAAIQEGMTIVKPDAVLHLAGMTQPNICEQDVENSRLINVEASRLLAELAAERAIPFVFSSTDLVFDGEKAPYRESDATDPVSVYGRHKMVAEKAIMGVHPLAAIARLPLLYGESDRGLSFLSNWVQKLKAGQDVFAFTDEYRTVVSASSAAEGLGLLLKKELSGVWHLGGRERLSRYEFALQIAQVFNLPLEQIRPSQQKEVQMAAPRPADVSLNSQKAFDVGYEPGLVVDELRQMAMEE